VVPQLTPGVGRFTWPPVGRVNWPLTVNALIAAPCAQELSKSGYTLNGKAVLDLEVTVKPYVLCGEPEPQTKSRQSAVSIPQPGRAHGEGHPAATAYGERRLDERGMDRS
jgi:hypothetical protein